jgi:hypothetical protein
MEATTEANFDVREAAPDMWLPPLFGKQWEIFNCRKRIVLVSGSRNSGKSIAVWHRLWRHMWETPGACVAVVVKAKSQAKGGGSWDQILGQVADKWLGSGMVGQTGLPIAFTTCNGEGIPGAKQVSDTRTPYFKIRNMYGGESECLLMSVDHDADAELKLKTKVFSMVYIAELSLFKLPRIISNAEQCLRCEHLKTHDGKPNPWMQIICDTNPDEELGNRSWVYEMFYKKRNMRQWHDDPKENRKSEIFYGSMALFEMFWQDNPFLTEEEQIGLERSCDGDPAYIDSWVKGIWGDAGKKRNRLFANVFTKEIHVLGESPSDQINVSPMTTTLYSGWDLGNVNHAAVLLDRWPFITPEGKELTGWSVLDELVYIKEELLISQFGREMLDKIRAIEGRSRMTFEWSHWSDSNAIDTWRPTSGTFDYLEIAAATNGTITLQGVNKPDGSVRARIRLLRRLLNQKRIYVSACCLRVIEMIENAKAGDSDKDAFDESENLKHIFDALTYPLYMECLAELQDANNKPAASNAESGVISSPL